MGANFNECEAAGLDFDQVDRLARRLSRAARDASKLGLTIFGGAGSGTLRTRLSSREAPLIVASIDEQNWDGGDGAERYDDDGLLRGENA